MTECRLAEKLTELRTVKGATQDEVAAALAVSNKTVSKWENGTSAPDLNMLIALAEYYNVSTDTLLGLSEGEKTVSQVMADAFSSLNRGEAALKSFEIVQTLFHAGYNCQGRAPLKDGETTPEDYIPHEDGRHTRNQIVSPEMFSFSASSDDVNIAVVHLPNRADFAWLWEDDQRRRIAGEFRLLSDPDALKVLGFLHTEGCSRCFTADYMAKNTGLSLEKAAEVLDAMCEEGGICRKRVAHLKEGDMEVYESYGDNLFFAMVTLAYERQYGRHYYSYNYSGDHHMIRNGGKKE